MPHGSYVDCRVICACTARRESKGSRVRLQAIDLVPPHYSHLYLKFLPWVALLLDLIDGMGANFQVFLIASVPAPEGGYVYQCVGAFNHFYCFGIRPLRALYRFFSLLRVRENAAMVRDELRSFSTWNLRDDPLEEWMNPAVPCPYAVSLLSIAWTTDLEHLPYLSNYSLGNGLLDARKDCWHRGQSLFCQWYARFFIESSFYFYILYSS